MSTHSKFDPLDMALGALGKQETPAAAPAEQPTSRATTAQRIPSNPPVPSVARNTRNAPKAKGQMNVYISTTAIEDLRNAVVELNGRFSLGDVVQQLIDDGLEQAVETLRSRTTDSTRLRSGRRVSQ